MLSNVTEKSKEAVSTAKKTVKSETMLFSYALVVAGVVQVNLPLVKEDLGVYYGYATIIVGAIVALLRFTTTKPIKEL